jgi:4-alpha-glucanotransferase
VFDAVADAIGAVPVVAENLGLITPPVERLRRTLDLPGTVVLQFSFTDEMVDGQTGGIPEDTVVYTGTHDNDTTVGWWASATAQDRERIERAVRARGWDETEPHWMLLRMAFSSAAVLAIVPAQDLLGLDSSARMNLPGRAHGNWRWRLEPGQLDASLAARLHDATVVAGRVPAS